jgi:hypothetical protein
MYSTRATLGDTAAEFGTLQVQFIPQHPKEWGIRLSFDGVFFVVNGKVVGCHKLYV